MHFSSPLGIFLANKSLLIYLGRKLRLLFNLQSLPELKWPKLQTQSSTDAQMGPPIQSSRESTRHTVHKMLPGKQILDIQDAAKSLELVDMVIHIDGQIRRAHCTILTSKTSTVCQNSNKCGLRVKHNRQHKSKTRDTSISTEVPKPTLIVK